MIVCVLCHRDYTVNLLHIHFYASFSLSLQRSSRQCNCDIISHTVTVKRRHVVWLGSAPQSTPCQMNIITISKTVVEIMIASLCSE